MQLNLHNFVSGKMLTHQVLTVRYLLDTNICIYISKKRPMEVYQRLSELNIGDVGMSLITFGELRFGAEKKPTSRDCTGKIGTVDAIYSRDYADTGNG